MANMTVEHVAGDIYKVGSASSDRIYTVDVGESTCTCINWAIQRNRIKGAAEQSGRSGNAIRYACKHIKEVGVVPTPTVKKKIVQRDSKEVAQKKADAIVAKFTKTTKKTSVVDDLTKLIDAAKKKG